MTTATFSTVYGATPVVVQNGAGAGPTTAAMPALISAAPDVQVSVPVGTTAWFAFAAGASVGPNCPGSLLVTGGAPAVFIGADAYGNPRTDYTNITTPGGTPLARAIGRPGDVYGTGAVAAQALLASGATQVTVLTSPSNAPVTITRGAATISG